jgi:TonB-dependent starch-binding outer membrane protein SusC
LANSGSDYDGDPGVLIGQFANDNLSWERNTPLSIAAEIGLFNRVNLTAEYYHRKTTDLLLRAPVSRTNGVIDLLQNLGSMENKGWELSLNTVNFDKTGNGFKWTTDINFTTLKNKVLSLATGDFVDGSYRRVVGKDINTWHTQDYAGVDPQTGRASWWVDETRTEKTNNYAQAKRVDLGNATPDFWGGLTNMLSFKGLALSFQINFVWGNIIQDNWANFTHSDGSRRDTDTGNMARYIYNNRWRKAGDVTDVPAVIWGNTTNSFQSSSRFLYDGSHARLRDLTLSYNLPDRLTRTAGLRSAMLFVRGNNLYVWSKDKRIWQDPQVDFDGQMNQELPVAKTFTFGIDLSF